MSNCCNAPWPYRSIVNLSARRARPPRRQPASSSYPADPILVSSLNPRNRMVVFRLTQEEYTRLRDACKSKGGRNLSEYTRSELLAMLQSDSIAGLIQKRFGELEEKL